VCLRFKETKLRESEDLRRAIAAGAELRNRRGRRITPLGLASIKKLIETLGSILDEAIEDEHIERNLARGSRMRIKAPKPPRTFLEMGELVALIDAAGEQDGPLARALDASSERSDGTRGEVARAVAQGMRAKDIAPRWDSPRPPSATTWSAWASSRRASIRVVARSAERWRAAARPPSSRRATPRRPRSRPDVAHERSAPSRSIVQPRLLGCRLKRRSVHPSSTPRATSRRTAQTPADGRPSPRLKPPPSAAIAGRRPGRASSHWWLQRSGRRSGRARRSPPGRRSGRQRRRARVGGGRRAHGAA
jgi:hypothetical protein